MNLLKLKPKGRFVFVGDTHGDLDASKKVIKKYLDKNTTISFLGDYVDRGVNSKENVEYLIEKKKENPKRINLLQGNHERYDVLEISDADFWGSLNLDERKKYSNIFKKFPLVISVGGIIALHGALPNVEKLEDINKIEDSPPDQNWLTTLWGDFEEGINYEDDGDWVYSRDRPTFGKEYFERIMKKLNKNVLIRSHDSLARQVMFDNKCLTIFTSNAYNRVRQVAIVDFDKKKKIESIDDLVIEEI
ncbi:MAG: metallophosphoesterase family protein [Nanoarchaeota archaeon]|mgnify:CR=1 FL=1